MTETEKTVDLVVSCPDIERVVEANLPTEFGAFRIVGFKNIKTGEEFVALTKPGFDPDKPALVRIHSQCLTGEVFHSVKCDCGQQLDKAMQMIEEEGKGAIIYQQQEGRGIGLMNKIRAYQLQDEGQDTVEANLSLGFEPDLRQYECCAEIIRQLGFHRVRLLSNNPEKISAVTAAGIDIVERVPLEVDPYDATLSYLRTKREKMGHLIDNLDESITKA